MPYRLGQLGYAVGVNAGDTTVTRLAADGRGSTGTQTKMSDFTGTPSAGGGNSVIIASATSTMWMAYGSVGSLFMSRIRSQTRNFGASWTFAVGPGGGDATYVYNPNDGGTFGTCSITNDGPVGDYTETVQWTFNDHYNGSYTIQYTPYIDIFGGES